MFGMEKQKDKNKSLFQFDIERELISADRRKELAKLIETRMLRIKEILRSGSKKEIYEQLGVLLNGYHALTCVLGRASHEVATAEAKKGSSKAK